MGKVKGIELNCTSHRPMLCAKKNGSRSVEVTTEHNKQHNRGYIRRALITHDSNTKAIFVTGDLLGIHTLTQ